MTEKTIEELTQEARNFESRYAEGIAAKKYSILVRAAERWYLAEDDEKAKAYWIMAAENVTGYMDEIDEQRGLLYERAGEYGKAIDSFEKAIRLYTEQEGRYDLHGDPKSGAGEAELLIRRVSKLRRRLKRGQLDMEEKKEGA